MIIKPENDHVYNMYSNLKWHIGKIILDYNLNKKSCRLDLKKKTLIKRNSKLEGGIERKLGREGQAQPWVEGCGVDLMTVGRDNCNLTMTEGRGLDLAMEEEGASISQ